MGGCQNYGLFLGTLNIRCRIIIGIQKGTIILATTHIHIHTHTPKLKATHSATEEASELRNNSGQVLPSVPGCHEG